MRVIAGEFKGRILQAPKDSQIRPTSDKVKEALFSMIAAELPGAVAIDLFAGSGGLGLEAVSRGAKRCYFCDSSKESLALVQKNVSICKAEARSVLVAGPYQKALRAIPEKADLIFLDPPYDKKSSRKVLLDCFAEISENEALREGGVIAAEHEKDEVLPEAIGGFQKIKEKKYGRVRLTLYG